jgi:hypothetical protein
MEAITENQHATTKDAHLDDFIAKAISRGDAQVGEIGLGDLDIAVRSFFICWLRCLLFVTAPSRPRRLPLTLKS